MNARLKGNFTLINLSIPSQSCGTASLIMKSCILHQFKLYSLTHISQCTLDNEYAVICRQRISIKWKQTWRLQEWLQGVWLLLVWWLFYEIFYEGKRVFSEGNDSRDNNIANIEVCILFWVCFAFLISFDRCSSQQIFRCSSSQSSDPDVTTMKESKSLLYGLFIRWDDFTVVLQIRTFY